MKAKTPKVQFQEIKSAIDSGAWPIFMHGQSGSGKTFAAAYVSMCWQVGRVAFLDSKKLISDFTIGGSQDRILNTVRDVGLLVLDEIGTRELSDAGREAWLDILNCRRSKPMILTCNHHPTILAEKLDDERIASRMLSGSVIEFPEFDQRMKS